MLKPGEFQNQGHEERAKCKQVDKNITNRIKPKLIEVVKTDGLEIYDIVKRVNFKKQINSNYEAPTIILSSDLIKINKNQSCHFYKENKAYITRGKKSGHYYYCSVNSKNEKFYLDIFDIFEIITGKDYVDIVSSMVKYFGFIIKENQDKNIYRASYINNIEMIGRGNFDICEELYPYLNKFAGLTFKNLFKFHLIALKNVYEDRDILNGTHVFFSSNSYMEEFFNTSTGTVGRYIAVLKLLGFIENVAYKYVPLQLRLKSEEERKKNKNFSKVNYFKINIITIELLQQAEDIAMFAINSGLKLRNITMSNIESVFGSKEVSRLYKANEEIIRASTESRKAKKAKLETANYIENQIDDRMPKFKKERSNKNYS